MASSAAGTASKVKPDDMNDRDRVLLNATMKAAAFGEIMSVLLQSPRHAEVTLGALARQLVPAFLADQYILARGKPAHPAAPPAPVGFVIWASVSEEVDERLQRQAGDFPVLGKDDWQSGDIIRILDVVAAPQVAAALLKSVREKVGPDRTIRFRGHDATIAASA